MKNLKLMAYPTGGDQYEGNGFTAWWNVTVWVHNGGHAFWVSFGLN